MPLVSGAPVILELLQLGAHIRHDHLVSVVIEAVHDPCQTGELGLLAHSLGATRAVGWKTGNGHKKAQKAQKRERL